MSKHVLRCFYTPGLRLHPAAKTEFVPPDLTPLPDPARAEITEVPWIRRRFPLSVSLAQAGQVLARLQGTPARLEEALSEIPQPLRTRRNHGSWSIQENAGHLADLEELWRARLDDFAAGRNELTPWEPTNERTELARHNESAIEKILSDFRSARGELVARARAIPREEYVRSAGHRRLKTRLRLLDHLFFVAEHDDHHLARILEETHRPDAGAR